MSAKTKSTVRMLCVRSDTVMRKELPEEAQKLLDLYNDPAVPPEQKEIARKELDLAIRNLENRVTTRRLNEIRPAGTEPSVP
jgi:hypothetical protein